jgi:hypothetical protein
LFEEALDELGAAANAVDQLLDALAEDPDRR